MQDKAMTIETKEKLLTASRAFIIYLMNRDYKKGDNILCNKDPENILYIEKLVDLFPNSRIIYMVRDGRASAYSRCKAFARTDIFMAKLKEWNYRNRVGYPACQKVGKKQCLLVKYEDLVTEPETRIRNVLDFLNIEFSEDFLNHQEFVGTELSK